MPNFSCSWKNAWQIRFCQIHNKSHKTKLNIPSVCVSFSTERNTFNCNVCPLNSLISWTVNCGPFRIEQAVSLTKAVRLAKMLRTIKSATLAPWMSRAFSYSSFRNFPRGNLGYVFLKQKWEFNISERTDLFNKGRFMNAEERMLFWLTVEGIL